MIKYNHVETIKPKEVGIRLGFAMLGTLSSEVVFLEKPNMVT